MRACHNGSELDLAYNDVISFINKNSVVDENINIDGKNIKIYYKNIKLDGKIKELNSMLEEHYDFLGLEGRDALKNRIRILKAKKLN